MPLIAPPLVVHDTPVFVVPVTLAVNCCEAPATSETELGLTLTATTETVTAAVADFVGSATLVALTV